MSTKDIFGWIATALSLPIFASPAIQFMQVIEGSLSYEESPTFLVGIIYCNCLAWYSYGDLIFSQQVKTCSILGCVLSLIFSIIYLAYEAKKYLFDALLNAVIIFTASWAAIRTFTIIIVDPAIVGQVCAVTFLIVLTYPLYLMYRFTKEKNYKLISVLVAESTVAGGVCWAIYGFLERENYILYPNLLAIFVGVAQIIVRKNYKANFPTIDDANEASTIGIEASPDDDNPKKRNSVEDRIDEENGEERDKIKSKPVKIVTEKEITV